MLNHKTLFTFFFLLSISSFSYSKEEQFICEYTREMKLSDIDTQNPKSTINKISERYTFILDGNKGYYINLSHGVKNPLTVVVNGGQLIFVENNRSDNTFIVTIFLDKRKNNKYPSVYSSHSWGKGFFTPSQNYGECY
jgi:hypothetical protein